MRHLRAAAELFKSPRILIRQQVREHIAGNDCRCTGCHAIVDAIMETIKAHRAAARDEA